MTGEYPAYRVPTTTPNAAALVWQPVVATLGLILLSQLVITQEVARALAYQPALGGRHFGLYLPGAWLWWSLRFALSTDPAFHAAIRDAFQQSAVAAVAGVVLGAVWTTRIHRDRQKGSEDLHGSARFAKVSEVLESPLASAATGPFIGAFHDTPNSIRYLRDASDEHIIATAPTGSAKTTGLVIPTLLDNPDWSMIVTDPKGELHQLTSGYRARHGKVLRFSPVDTFGSRYNLFAEVRLGTLRDVSDAQNIAKIFCHVPGRAAVDPHWDDIAESLITGVILHEGYKAKRDGRTMTGRDIALALTPIDKDSEGKQKTFISYLEEMLTFEHDPDGIRYHWTLPDGRPTLTHPVVIEKAMEMVNRMNKEGPTDEFLGALSTAKRRFEIYSDPLIQRNTADSDFHILDLVDGPEPVTLYLVLPLSDLERLLPMTRVLLTLLFNRMTEPGRDALGKRRKLLLLLEEFPILKRMEIFSERLPLVRGFGIKAFLIAQSAEQIIDAYGDHESIVNNCGIQLAYTPTDDKTKQLLESRIGLRTVHHIITSFSGKFGAWSKSQTTSTVQSTKRPLMTADEIGRLRAPRKVKVNGQDRIEEPGDMLIFRPGQYPILGRQMLYFLDPVLRKRSELPEVTEWPHV